MANQKTTLAKDTTGNTEEKTLPVRQKTLRAEDNTSPAEPPPVTTGCHREPLPLP